MKKNNPLIDKQNQKPIAFTKLSSANNFGTRIKNRVTNGSHILQNSLIKTEEHPTNDNSNSLVSLTQSSTFQRKQIDDSLDSDQSLLSQKIDLKRTKSVRFNQSPLIQIPVSIQKKSSSKILVPILKNSAEKLNLNSSHSKNNMTSSFTSHVGSQKSSFTSVGISISKQISNEKKKYLSILEQLKKSRKKHFDQLFPPGAASLYYNPKDTKYGEVKWIRISQIFKGYNISIFNKNQEEKSSISCGQVKIMNMVSSFGSVSHSNKLLQRIFQDQKYNQIGIYYLRLFQQGVWKYTLIDDYIPVKIAEKKIIPLFLNVVERTKKNLQIWPYLLQKALAKTYSTYESLTHLGNTQDLMNEISGSMIQNINIKKQNAYYQLRRHFMNPQNLILISKSEDNYLPVVRQQKKSSFYQITQETFLKINNPFESIDQSIQTSLSDLITNYKTAMICKFNQNYHSIGYTIKQGVKDSYSIRQFIVESFVNCDISLIQKDKKYFRNTGYSYSWARLMIVMKQKEGFRWINGGFSNQKFIQLSCLLDPGIYFAIVMVQWGNRIYDINLHYHGNSPINFQRRTLSEYPNILQETCIDLAQRFGQFKQLSPNLCSYRHVDYFNGFIIQNINNESNKKEVAIIKSYEKIFQDVQKLVIPLNGDFINNKNIISTKIRPKENYTLILKVRGNEDMSFMDYFIFDQ